MKNICGIYQIKNMLNGKVYVGSSNNIRERINFHFRNLIKNKHYNPYLQYAFNKNQKKSFKSSVIEICDEGDLEQKEQYWINKRKACDERYGYNVSRNTKAFFRGLHHTRKSRNKIAKKLIGKKRSKSTIRAMRQGHKNMSAKTRKERSYNISKALKGKKQKKSTTLARKRTIKKMSPRKIKIWRNKITRQLIGRKLSKEHILAVKKAFKNMSAKKKIKMQEKRSMSILNMNPKIRKKWIKANATFQRNRWKNMTKKEYKSFCKKVSDGQYKNSTKLSGGQIRRWKNMSQKDYIETCKRYKKARWGR